MAKNTRALKTAQRLRKEATLAEHLLWLQLRSRRLGIKFRRQMPLVVGKYNFIADFYCAERKLIIEIDGGIHYDPVAADYDLSRQNMLKENSYQILRFNNKDIFENLDWVLGEIRDRFINSPKPPSRPPS